MKDRLEYRVDVTWDKETGGAVNIGHFPSLRLDMPTDFGGRGRHPCPDELFLSAIAACLLTTFLYFKNTMRFPLEEFHVSATQTIEKPKIDGYRIMGIEALIRLKVKSEERPKAERCVELAKRYCHITRTLETAIPIHISTQFQSDD